MATINKEELLEVLKRFRNMRARHVRRGGDPWAFRQALIMVLELDTVAALERGIEAETLASFDATIREDSQMWVRGRG